MAGSERGGASDRRYGQGNEMGYGGRMLIINHCKEFDLDYESEYGMNTGAMEITRSSSHFNRVFFWLLSCEQTEGGKDRRKETC